MRNNTNAHATPFIRNEFGRFFMISGVVPPDRAPEGALVCKSGYTTEINCGVIIAIFGNLIHSDGTSHERIVIIKDMVCYEGDSGGPVFALDELTSETYLIGMVMSALIENGTNYCNVHPVDAILVPEMEVMTIYNTPNISHSSD
ncbi:31018_t:CDS:1 [Gigaspora margarita]|uniref:31018_t:CDS:1 n=1 Tax=Gigaspora margarita TaxID=4874 RepID=A0ABN7X7X8_GIGMA|nr:31018_t:CDS:1 [Gigaspora margarita]